MLCTGRRGAEQASLFELFQSMLTGTKERVLEEPPARVEAPGCLAFLHGITKQEKERKNLYENNTLTIPLG